MFKKGNKGITLIALVITIIVLLILAGVTIAQITGQDSAPQKAADAKLENEKGAAKDEATMLAAQYVQEYMEKKYVQNIKVEETTGNVQDKKLEVGQDGNSIYKVSGVELPKMLADGEETIPAIVGDYVAQQFSSRASQEGSYNYSTSGRSLTIKTRSNEDLVSGTINDDGTITWDGNSSGSTEGTTKATKISVNGEEITLTADNAKDYYGTIVTKINNIDYGIYYIDFDGYFGETGTVYLKATNAIGKTGLIAPNEITPRTIEIMSQLNPDWPSKKTWSEMTFNERKAASLCDPSNSLWSELQNEFENQYGTNNVNYVVGAPSSEMLTRAINEATGVSGSNALDSKWFSSLSNYGYLYSITGKNANDDTGYKASWDLPNYQKSLLNNKQLRMYFGDYSNNNATSQWLASPCAMNSSIYVCLACRTNYNTYSMSGGGDAGGICPLVSLKPGVDLRSGTKITVDGKTIDLNKLDATTVAQYYGTTVKEINGVEYGLFYVDYAGKYGAAGTVYLRAKSSIGDTDIDEYTLPSEGSGSSSSSSSSSEESSSSDPGIDPPENAIEIMKQINPDWANNRGNNLSASEYLASERGAAYLCDEDNSMWSGIGSSFDSNYLNYVIGAPSVEMFLDSYNAKYPNSSPKYTTAFRSAGQNYSSPGYLYSNNNGSSYSYFYSGAIQTGDSTVGGMYKNPNAYEWLASPLSASGDYYVCGVYEDGGLDYDYWDGSYGVAPLVSLKSGVDLTN